MRPLSRLLCCFALFPIAPAFAQEITQIQTLRDSADGLLGARAVAVDPTGTTAYVAGAHEDRVALFARDPVFGDWRYVDRYVDGVDGVDGLDGAIDVAVSPDGLRVYVLGEDDDALAVFERDLGSGRLTFLGVLRDGDPGVDGLDRPAAMSIVQDGSYVGRVYVVSFGESTLAAFDPSFPTLDPVGVWRNGDPGITGMSNPTDVVVLQGTFGLDVYVTSQTDSALSHFGNELFSGFAQLQVLRDGQDGVDGLASPQALTALPDGTYLFVGSFGEDAVAGFARDVGSGQISYSSISRNFEDGNGLDGVLSLEAAPGGEHVYVGGGLPITILPFIFDFIPEISTYVVDSIEHDLDFGSLVSEASHPQLVFPIPRFGFAFPGDDTVLATQSYNSTLTAYDRDFDGTLTHRQTIPDGSGAIGVPGAQVVVTSPDGRNVYLLGGDEALVSEFSRDPVSGLLSFLGVQRSANYGPFITPPYRSATMSPDGKNLYVIDYRLHRIAVFRRDVLPGRLYLVQEVISNTPAVPDYIQFDTGAVSPDGTRFYSTAILQNSISIFARDPATGLLTYLATHTEEGDLHIGMYAPQAVIAGPNGAVYVGGSANVHMPLELYFDSNGNYVGTTIYPNPPQLCGGITMAFDPTYTHLYTGQHGANVCLITRGPSGLSYTGSGFIPGKQGYVHSVAVAPNGRRVYATAYDGLHPNVGHSALAVFGRDPATGALALLDTIDDTDAGIDDTQGLVGVAVSPNSRHVYGAAFLDNAVVAFAPEPGAALAALAAVTALAAQRRSRRRRG